MGWVEGLCFERHLVFQAVAKGTGGAVHDRLYVYSLLFGTLDKKDHVRIKQLLALLAIHWYILTLLGGNLLYVNYLTFLAENWGVPNSSCSMQLMKGKYTEIFFSKWIAHVCNEEHQIINSSPKYSIKASQLLRYPFNRSVFIAS